MFSPKREDVHDRGSMVERAGFEPAYGKPGQIYSLLPLTTRPPLQGARRAQWRAAAMLSTARGRAHHGPASFAPSAAAAPRRVPSLTGPRPVRGWSG